MQENFLRFLQTRRSVPARHLHGPPPRQAEIETILSIAARVPDHGRLVPWRFIVFSGEGQNQAAQTLIEIYQQDHPEGEENALLKVKDSFTAAPLIIAVVSCAQEHAKIPIWEQILSAGAVCMNMIHAANALDFSATWYTGWYAYHPEVLKKFGLSLHEKIAGFLHIGRTEEIVPDRSRPSLSSITTYYTHTS